MKKFISWIKISYTWKFKGGQKTFDERLEKAYGMDDVAKIRDDFWEAKGQYYPNHWATKDAMGRCDSRMVLLRMRAIFGAAKYR